MKRKRREVIRYSESFKQQILTELEKGSTIESIRKKYGINGSTTIQRWIRKSGNLALQTKVIRVETPKERDRIKALEAEIRRLKETMADIVVDRVIAESTLEAICEEKGWDIEEVKKNIGKRSPQKQSKRK